MKKILVSKIFVIIITALYAYLMPPFVLFSQAKGVKTSYKQYSIFKFNDEDILCEAYIVSKDDWLYKIFRKKGEISEQDFPQFIIIFKKINPKINNVDAIEPGIHILIPLKKIKKKEYEQSSPGKVDIPVIEFSAMVEDLDLKPFIQKHKIQKGETISDLIDKDFLETGGAISKEGIQAFKLTNPGIKNINIIYEGADIYLPDPSIKSQSWFKSTLSGKIPISETKKKKIAAVKRKIDAHELAQLKKYSALIGGTLLNQGKMYFPGRDGSSQVLDLSYSPVIENDDGSKILIISGNNVNAELLEYVQTYWKGIKTQLVSETLDKIKSMGKNKNLKKYSTTREYKKDIEQLLSQTDYDYIPDAKIPFTINNINLEAKFGRVIRQDAADLLINFGDVYGVALKALEKREFIILSLTPKMSTLDIAQHLFSSLGYTTWRNPSFSDQGRLQTINGLYAVKNRDKTFVSIEPLSINSQKYLEKENIKILTTRNRSQIE